MANELHGKSGKVYANPLLIQSGATTWAEQAVGGVALSTVSGPTAITTAARATTTAVGPNTLLMSKAVTSMNLSTYSALLYWFRSGLALTAGQMAILLDDTALGVSPIETLNVPAMAAATWQMCLNDLAAAPLDIAIIDIALKQVASLGNTTFDISDVYALQGIDGAKDWSIKYNLQAAEVTGFQDTGTKRYIPGQSGWGGSFTAFKTGTPINIGAQVYMAFDEGITLGQTWMGNAIITDVSPKVSISGVVEYSYSFTGSGALQLAIV